MNVDMERVNRDADKMKEIFQPRLHELNSEERICLDIMMDEAIPYIKQSKRVRACLQLLCPAPEQSEEKIMTLMSDMVEWMIANADQNFVLPTTPEEARKTLLTDKMAALMSMLGAIAK